MFRGPLPSGFLSLQVHRDRAGCGGGGGAAQDGGEPGAQGGREEFGQAFALGRRGRGGDREAQELARGVVEADTVAQAENGLARGLFARDGGLGLELFDRAGGGVVTVARHRRDRLDGLGFGDGLESVGDGHFDFGQQPQFNQRPVGHGLDHSA